MARIEKTAFISYRRTDDSWALAIFQDLNQHGYDVFIDYDGIASGDFEIVILENIRARAHFLVLLTPTALERCGDPEDWMRREIEAALDSRRNIVPLMLKDFDFGTRAIASQLTGRLAELKKYNGLKIPGAAFFSSQMGRLRNKFLNVEVDTVLQPASDSAQQAATEQKDKATMALEDEQRKPDGNSKRAKTTRDKGNILPAPPRGKYAGLVGPNSFHDIHNLIADLLRRPNIPGPVRVRNIALDMERTWALIRDELMRRSWPKTLEWRSLMVDGSAEVIKKLENSGPLISARMARLRASEILKHCSTEVDALAKANVTFACRAYSEVPIVHGFLIDEQILFASFCADDGTVLTIPPSYIRFDSKPGSPSELDTTTAEHFIRVFSGWFNSRWEKARPVWPTRRWSTTTGTLEY